MGRFWTTARCPFSPAQPIGCGQDDAFRCTPAPDVALGKILRPSDLVPIFLATAESGTTQQSCASPARYDVPSVPFSLFSPRLLRPRAAAAYLGMNKNNFDRLVRPSVRAILTRQARHRFRST